MVTLNNFGRKSFINKNAALDKPENKSRTGVL
jgi:hypothetical protein